MRHGDQNSAAAFNALQFGQGIQNQMSQQELAQQGLAGDMQKSLWGAEAAGAGLENQRYGMDQQYDLGRSGQDLQRYGMDQNYGLGQGRLDLNRQGQDFNQMMGLEGTQFRNRQYGDQQQMYQDQLLMSMLGMNPVPTGSQVNPYGPYNQNVGTGGGSSNTNFGWG